MLLGDNTSARAVMLRPIRLQRVGLEFQLDSLLWAGRSGDRIPVRARFSAPVQTGCEAHPVSYTIGARSFPGVKRPGHGVDQPPPSSAVVRERVELYLCSPSGPSWPVLL